MRRIFVFGSNLAGRHGRGAALTARRLHGAALGTGCGPTGNAYAIPTKNAALHPLSLPSVIGGIQSFLDFAREHMHDGTVFDVTRIGCGLAGFTDEQIAPAFADAPANCVLPYRWQLLLGRESTPRVIVAGSRSFDDYVVLKAELDFLLGTLKQNPIIVSGSARGTDQLGERYANERCWHVLTFPADWKAHGKSAGMMRNTRMAWSASHLVAFWDGESPGTKHMIETATSEGLDVRIVPILKTHNNEKTP